MKQPVSMFLARLGLIAGLLVGAGCTPSAPSISLHDAVKNGNTEAVRKHIAAKTDLDAKDKTGWTPVHWAVLKGNLNLVKTLAAGGADLQVAGSLGKTPLDLARDQGQVAIAKFLMEQPEKKTGGGGRGLVDGGLGVSGVLDSQ